MAAPLNTSSVRSWSSTLVLKDLSQLSKVFAPSRWTVWSSLCVVIAFRRSFVCLFFHCQYSFNFGDSFDLTA